MKIKNILLLLLALFIMTNCVGTSSTGVFGTGVSIATDPRTIGTQIDDSIMEESLAARIIARDKKYILSVTQNGFGKRTSFYEYRVTNRGGKGIIGIVTSTRNGDVAASFPVNEGDEIILSTDKGRVIRCAVKEIRIGGRNTQGVRIFKLSGEEKVVSAIKIEDNFI